MDRQLWYSEAPKKAKEQPPVSCTCALFNLMTTHYKLWAPKVRLIGGATNCGAAEYHTEHLVYSAESDRMEEFSGKLNSMFRTINEISS